MYKILTFVILFSLSAKSQNSKEIFTMFYNVENLFDTINDPITQDEEFLPSSSKEWDTEKYTHKIKQLTKVFSSINNNKYPNLIGLCEIENKSVIEDLLKEPFFKDHSYTIIHKNSSDSRGIDCSLLFDKNFELLNHDFIEVKIPDARTTRDIVYAQLKLKEDVFHVFVNHWPSRMGGEKKTEPKRVFVSSILREYIDQNIEDGQFIIIMGDLNDYPSNKSVRDILVKKDMTNLILQKEWIDIGSYNWKNEWNFLDHIIVSNNLLNSKSKIQVKEFNVLNKEWMLYTKKSGKKCPNRTYGGSNWYGGFSDHLPVYCVFTIY